METAHPNMASMSNNFYHILRIIENDNELRIYYCCQQKDYGMEWHLDYITKGLIWFNNVSESFQYRTEQRQKIKMSHVTSMSGTSLKGLSAKYEYNARSTAYK
jgi:hypothetical protein